MDLAAGFTAMLHHSTANYRPGCLVFGAWSWRLGQQGFQASTLRNSSTISGTNATMPSCLPACLSGCLAVPWGAVLQSKREMLENMAANKGQIKLRMDQIRKTDMGLAVQSLPEPETWNVQVFRSIDSGGEAGGARGVG